MVYVGYAASSSQAQDPLQFHHRSCTPQGQLCSYQLRQTTPVPTEAIGRSVPPHATATIPLPAPDRCLCFEPRLFHWCDIGAVSTHHIRFVLKPLAIAIGLEEDLGAVR